MTDVTLTGGLFPWGADEQPVLIHIVGGSPSQHLPVFTTPELLRATMSRAGVEYAKIKQIMDGAEFLDSIPLDIIVIKDPWYTLKGTIRYTQIQREVIP